MSWSATAKGTPSEVKKQLDQAFSGPLADAPAGLDDKEERETVFRIHETISQILRTFDPEKVVAVSAYGHMGYADYDSKKGKYQNVNLTIA
jgi:hypothetical protein